uniref:NADH-ubiquinone oxidoreductase chain 2 n=1 Tax=Cynoponticus ferox TaxID=391196 RepID=D1YTR9_CYNFE|nr:NADH dehydrogenase subunit 2 [Cynoponticus ferox]BAI53303.1 NADH dehydrogenase subunit 2 [Cynoponticus ferox]
MNPYILYTIMMSLGLGTTITFASSHWFLAWVGLEINTLAIMPLMAQHHHPRAVEATTKYFITQAAGAALLLFSTTMNMWILGNNLITSPLHPILSATTVLALGLKMGLAPMHFWLPEVMQGLTLVTGLILSTWQKLAPMILMYQLTINNSPTITTLGLLSILTGGWGGLNQTQLRKILAYSSIAHMGWMMIILNYAKHLTMLNLMIYIMLTTTFFMSLNMMSATKINKLAMTWAKSPTLTTIILLTMLSLAGLPPLTGFMPKWLILQELSKQAMMFTATIAAIAALLSLYFYLRVCYTVTLTTSPSTNNAKTPWRLKQTKSSLPLSFMAIMATTLLPVAPMMTVLTI